VGDSHLQKDFLEAVICYAIDMNQKVELQAAGESDEAVLSELLYEYQKELLPYTKAPESAIKSYKYLPNYFTDSDRAAFFIMVNGSIGGFVLINKHTIIEKDAHSIAEFYVKPAFRKSGVGQKAAQLVFKKFPGKWEVAQIAANKPAINFWRETISAITGGKYNEVVLDTNSWQGPVQTFTIT